MSRVSDKAALTVREIEYTIQIRDKDKSFSELKDVLRAELTRFDENIRHRRPDAENPIREFLRTNIERSILIRENTRIYFLNYREKEGSLQIEFKLLVIASYINFGPIRQALDYLVKDTIADYFEELLERHFPVSISVQANDKEIFTVPDSYPAAQHAEVPKPDHSSRILSIISIILTCLVLLFLIYRALRVQENREVKDLKEKYMELYMEKKINEAVAKEKYNVILYNPADTLQRPVIIPQK